MEIKRRSEAATNDTWDLTSLFTDEKAWESGMKTLKEEIDRAPSFKGKLGSGKEGMLETFAWYEKTGILAERLYSWAFLNYAADASDSSNVKRYSLVSQALAQLGANMAYFDPELLAIEDKRVASYLADPAFSSYKVYLEKSRRFKAHVLSEAEERIMALQSEVGSTARTTFGDLTNVDFDFGTIETEEGPKPLTQSTYSSFLMSEDRALRALAYKQFYSAYDKHKHTIARLYEGQVKQDKFSCTARLYESCRQKALFADKVPMSVYDNLIDSVHEALPSLHRYYALRSRLMNLEKLAHYDVYVPLVSGVQKNTPYEEAVEIICKALAPLGEEYVSTLKKGLTTDRWVDRYENKGKRSGAFSSGGYTGKPYILLNYKEDVLKDLFTVAHEGGHSMHSYFSARNNPFFHYDYTIFEAEVASTFNEQLVATYLFETAEDKKTKAFILSKGLDDIVATLFRQTMFAEFEDITHRLSEEGVPLTVDLLREEYRKLLVLYFGPSVELEEVSDLEGLRIPHFYSSFYVYKYATGISAAIALSQKVLNGGEKEKNDYLSFLKSGGSTYPIESLKKAGVDMEKREPVQSALKHFSSLLDEFEALL
ncbi:oligoendopeptidase F [Sphaerochaeta sp. PS]|uniref:oligoendopeptidase F n=1 Tax=Sphaerochaeta sp. PS TaxID=3076336 RepID=UPI0028A46AAE|nr:oligoendopeptidase F [Sphaerochaeta sp. PS]MDT4762069.1 oligoendopeptidase F [Sphaerochaeta sp. PS]